MKNTKDYWNKVADNKKFTHNILINEISGKIIHDSKILDVGCGYGRILDYLDKLNYKNLTGLDFSERMIERGRRLYPDINFKIMSDNIIPFDDSTFDCVILFAVLTCIINNGEQISLLNEINRVLKSGGIVYISDYLLNEDDRNINRYEKYKNKYENYGTFEIEYNGVVRHHDREWIKEITSAFDEIKYKEIIHTTMNGNKSNGFYFIGEKK